jgi:hypothetical protein
VNRELPSGGDPAEHPAAINAAGADHAGTGAWAGGAEAGAAEGAGAGGAEAGAAEGAGAGGAEAGAAEGAGAGGTGPAGVPPEVARLAVAVADLDDLGELPVPEHVARYDAVHAELSEALGSIDEI